jgi:hypothetical protein
MKVATLIAGLMLLAGNVWAHPQEGEGYRAHLNHSRHVEMVDWEKEGVYVNSPSELPAGKWQCQKMTSYQGGPKSGYTKSFYMCRSASKRLR